MSFLRLKELTPFVKEALQQTVRVAKFFCCFHVTNTYICTNAYLVGPSMIPTFNGGDFVLAERVKTHLGKIGSGDLVLLRSPDNPRKIVTKIVKGVEGDVVSYFKDGITFHKSKGQHILKNSSVVDTIVQKSGIKPTDVILEIGPGTSNLTEKLLEAGKSVVAIELDPRMVLKLQTRFRESPHFSRLKVIQGDFLKCDLPDFDICVANIPYQISSPLTFKLLAHRPLFRCAILMFQKEFAMRLVAQPGDTDYSRLSVNTQLLSRVNPVLKVGRHNFTPEPRVDSSVVRIEPRIPLPSVNFKEWDGLVRICFSRKNKTLGAIFKQKSVISLLEKNYKTLQALQLSPEGLSSDEGEMASSISAMVNILGDDDNVEDDDNEMEMDNGDSKAFDFKEKVVGVLRSGCYEDKRSSKLTQADFMHLLSLFNKAGIHFS